MFFHGEKHGLFEAEAFEPSKYLKQNYACENYATAYLEINVLYLFLYNILDNDNICNSLKRSW